ncbi:MAG: hypothetical protein ACYTDY_08835 [Planctomycetota bacterium]|jgi:hypothetical protein
MPLGLVSQAVVFFMLGYVTLFSFPLLYVIIRWRFRGDGESGLGHRAGVLYFRSISLLAGLTAVTFLLFSLVSEEDQTDLRKTSLGILVASGLFFGLHHFLCRWLRSEDRADPAERIFGGFVLLLSGLILFSGLIVLFIALISEGDHEETVKLGACMTGVWLVTYGFQSALLRPEIMRKLRGRARETE